MTQDHNPPGHLEADTRQDDAKALDSQAQVIDAKVILDDQTPLNDTKAILDGQAQVIDAKLVLDNQAQNDTKALNSHTQENGGNVPNGQAQENDANILKDKAQANDANIPNDQAPENTVKALNSDAQENGADIPNSQVQDNTQVLNDQAQANDANIPNDQAPENTVKALNSDAQENGADIPNGHTQEDDPRVLYDPRSLNGHAQQNSPKVLNGHPQENDAKGLNGHAQESGKFELLQQWHSQPRKLRIIHVGAGATGLCAAYKFERQLTDYELVCYDENDEVGGTWLKNRYPGCACDVPAHIYTYTFEPNPNWDSYYAHAPAIHKYFVDFCKKYDLMRFIKLRHRILGATWHEDKAQWEVVVEHDGQTFTDWCDILVNGSGLLTKYRWPDIDGLHSFKGSLLHSGHWDDSVDYAGKRVAVLGNGSSAIQIIPEVQKVASELKCFMRGPTWIASPMPRVPVELSGPGGESEVIDKDSKTPEVRQYYYTEREKQRLINDPEYLLEYRKSIESAINVGFAIFYKDTEASNMVEKYMVAGMRRRLKDHPVLTEKLIPKWAVGCRRLTPGDGYLESLIEPNVECTFSEIASVDETGVLTADGVHREVDVIICATGYDMAWTPHFSLIGRDGQDIKDAWSPLPKCYLGMAAPGFPNYYVMNGPRGNLANGTVLPCFETELEYVIQVAKKMQSDRIKAVDVREEIVDQLNEYIDTWQETAVFSGNCRSWYKNNTVNGKVLVWGGSSIHFLKTIKTPRFEHFKMDYMEANPWAFLGNGRIRAEAETDVPNITPYLRNADTPWTIE